MNYYSTINSIVIYIENKIKKYISYMDLVKDTGYSLVHLRSIFKNKLKTPLAKYILQRKIAHAAHEIIYSNKRITDIAFSYGFEGYDAFTRAFKRIVGVTPSQFKKNPNDVSIGYISSGVYAPIIKKKGNIMYNKKIDNGSECILYGVPEIDFGYGVNSTFPSCLKTSLDYLGQKTSYDHIMTYSGAAFRLRWNTKYLDLGNVDIMNIYEDDFEVFDLCFKSVGRKYNVLKRTPKTTKSDFIDFIKKEIDKGRPCIALGIIGPPEACLLTGYRNNGEELLGYSLFQNEPQFCTTTTFDESGYFVCSDWWENINTIAVMTIGEPDEKEVKLKDIIYNAVEVLTCNHVKQYSGGQAAYDNIKEFILRDENWTKNNTQSRIIEQVITFGDSMVMICNRSSAANFFEQYEYKDNIVISKLKEVAKICKTISLIPEEITSLPGSWDMSERMLENICKKDVRKNIANCLTKSKDLEKIVITLLNDIILD